MTDTERRQHLTLKHVSDLELIKKCNHWINKVYLDKSREQGRVDTFDSPDDLDVVLNELVQRFEKLRRHNEHT